MKSFAILLALVGLLLLTAAVQAGVTTATATVETPDCIPQAQVYAYAVPAPVVYEQQAVAVQQQTYSLAYQQQSEVLTLKPTLRSRIKANHKRRVANRKIEATAVTVPTVAVATSGVYVEGTSLGAVAE